VLFETASSSILCPPWARVLRHGRVEVKKPSSGALALALIPFAAMCFSVSFWDRIDPMLFGLPFNLFWLISWIVLSTICMWIAYRLEAARNKQDSRVQ
jgi:hypothetical protein